MDTFSDSYSILIHLLSSYSSEYWQVSLSREQSLSILT